MAQVTTTIPTEAQLDFLLSVERLLAYADQVRQQRDRLLAIARDPGKAAQNPRQTREEPAR